jgi:hypothetical protein
MNNPSLIIAIAFILLGLYCILGGLYDWDELLESRRARTVVVLFGRCGARVSYMIIGFLAITVGIFLLSNFS